MRFRIALYCLVICSFYSCSSDETPMISESAIDYLNEVLDIMEANSINKYTIDWTDFRAKVFEKAANAQSIPETYDGIREALIMLEDNHSIYYQPGGSRITVALKCEDQTLTFPQLPSNIGYVKINAFSGSSNSTAAISFAAQIQNQIQSQDHDEMIGWIVDLRNNGGGNMWPMIAGIGPILGEGVAGYFIQPDNYEYSWGYSAGASIADEEYIVTQLDDFYELLIPNPKVAVLLNGGVASSGEVMAISFINRPNTRSFGAPTCGLSTSNTMFTLSDNARLFLTTAYLADRNKNQFGGEVAPDVMMGNQAALQSAIEWIEE